MLHVCIQLFSHSNMTTHLGLVGFCCFVPLSHQMLPWRLVHKQSIYIYNHPSHCFFFPVKIFVCISSRISYTNTPYLHHFGPFPVPFNLFPHCFPLLLKRMPSTSIIINVTCIFILTYDLLDSIRNRLFVCTNVWG